MRNYYDLKKIAKEIRCTIMSQTYWANRASWLFSVAAVLSVLLIMPTDNAHAALEDQLDCDGGTSVIAGWMGIGYSDGSGRVIADVDYGGDGRVRRGAPIGAYVSAVYKNGGGGPSVRYSATFALKTKRGWTSSETEDGTWVFFRAPKRKGVYGFSASFEIGGCSFYLTTPIRVT